MSEHYLTAITTPADAREVFAGCRCGWVVWVSSNSFRGVFESHVAEARAAEEEAAAEPMPTTIQWEEIKALAERLGANADFIFGKEVKE